MFLYIVDVTSMILWSCVWSVTTALPMIPLILNDNSTKEMWSGCPQFFQPQRNAITKDYGTCSSSNDCDEQYECIQLESLTGPQHYCCPSRAFICGMAPNYGELPCTGRPKKRYYFSTISRQCEKLTFTGCGEETGNIFQSIGSCEQFCSDAACPTTQVAVVPPIAIKCDGIQGVCPETAACVYNSLTDANVCCVVNPRDSSGPESRALEEIPKTTQPIRITYTTSATTPRAVPQPSPVVQLSMPKECKHATKHHRPALEMTEGFLRPRPQAVPRFTSKPSALLSSTGTQTSALSSSSSSSSSSPTLPTATVVTTTRSATQPAASWEHAFYQRRPPTPLSSSGEDFQVLASRFGGSCVVGTPLVLASNTVVYCKRDTHCPGTHSCESGLCCPKTEHVCGLDYEIGTRCSPEQRSQIRWYYDSVAGICRSFAYLGCDGNENRFMNKRKCKVACSRATNKRFRRSTSEQRACAVGEPYGNDSISCEENDDCPAMYSCQGSQCCLTDALCPERERVVMNYTSNLPLECRLNEANMGCPMLSVCRKNDKNQKFYCCL